MIKIVHIITGLGNGGAEYMLYKLLKYSNNEKYYHEVISLMDEGVHGKNIEKLGIKVHCLHFNKKNVLSSLNKAKKICYDTDIINTWLYHADLFGFILAKILLKKRLIWNIRHSNLDKNANKLRTLKIVRLNSFLSKYVDFITYNSNDALNNHVQAGYINRNYAVIPNGFELDKFKFNLDDRLNIRKKLKLKEEDRVIITVGRWNIQKDYYTLLKALAELKKQGHNFKMIMVGSNLDCSNNELVTLLKTYNLEDNMILLGRQENVPALLSAADIYVSSSLGESFSNSIGEAMACELYCVVTDVGDSKLLIGDTGKVVNPQDHRQLCQALLYYIDNFDIINKRNKRARQRILDNYEIKKVVRSFEDNFEKLV